MIHKLDTQITQLDTQIRYTIFFRPTEDKKNKRKSSKHYLRLKNLFTTKVSLHCFGIIN
jgi:hypothetical protein